MNLLEIPRAEQVKSFLADGRSTACRLGEKALSATIDKVEELVLNRRMELFIRRVLRESSEPVGGRPDVGRYPLDPSEDTFEPPGG